MKPPFFSVLTPSWNQGAWLAGCIQSVLAQECADLEHLVFDNCSTDHTAEVLAEFPHLQVFREPDTGQAQALNKALRLAQGEVICWLNADDQYVPGAFAKVRQAFADPGVDVIFGNAQEDFCDGEPPRLRRARFAQRDDLLFWWEKRTDLLQPAVFFRRRAALATGLLREDLHLILDTEFWWRLSAAHAFHYLDAPLALQQRQPDSKTIKYLPRIYEEKARVFGPLLAQARPHRRWRDGWARRIGMGRRWTGLAQSASPRDPAVARDFLRRARQENFLLCLSPRWWAACWAARSPASSKK